MSGKVFVIAGGGPCAASAAATLRSTGFDGRLVVVADEPVAPYERPPLSKDYLTGVSDGTELPVRGPAWYGDNDVELRLGERVDSIDDRTHSVRLGDGEDLRYDALLVATGGRPRPFAGIESDRVVYLRTVDDADRLAKQLRQGDPLLVLGGGFIGCEVAAAARHLGVEVTVLEMAPVPLERALGARLGGIVGEIHREAGVDFRTDERVESVVDTGDGLLVNTDRAQLECGLLLAAVGMAPNVEMVAGTAVETGNGILVDEHCRTSVPDIYAAGDVGAHFHPLYGRHLRVEHHDNAIKHGAAAARNMLGEDVAYADPHWFWSNQYDYNLQSAGFDFDCDEVVLRGSVADRSFTRFSLADGQVRAVVSLDRGRDVITGRRLIASGARVSPEALSDESVDLKRLTRAAGR